jgi:hypothetical protein
VSNEWLNEVISNTWPVTGENGYIALSSFEEINYKTALGDAQFIPNLGSWLNTTTNYDLIFNSGDVTTYMHDALWNNN